MEGGSVRRLEGLRKGEEEGVYDCMLARKRAAHCTFFCTAFPLFNGAPVAVLVAGFVGHSSPSLFALRFSSACLALYLLYDASVPIKWSHHLKLVE